MNVVSTKRRWKASSYKFSELASDERLWIIDALGLASALEVPQKVLWQLTFDKRDWNRYLIPKRRKGLRELWVPGHLRKSVLYGILRRILDLLPPSENAMAYFKSLSILKNAKKHEGNKYLLKLDLTNFFPSITKKNIKKEMQKIGIGEEAAYLIAQIATDPHGRLSQGSPASPALSNLVMREFDEEVSKMLAGMFNESVVYTRYSDDLAFSTKDEEAKRWLFNEGEEEIGRLVTAHGFKLNTRKTAKRSPGGKLWVTGFNIFRPNNSSPVHVGAPRRIRDKLKAMVHNVSCVGVGEHNIHTVAIAQKLARRDPGRVMELMDVAARKHSAALLGFAQMYANGDDRCTPYLVSLKKMLSRLDSGN